MVPVPGQSVQERGAGRGRQFCSSGHAGRPTRRKGGGESLSTDLRLADTELELEGGVLLPGRETLALINIVVSVPVNLAFAINAATINSSANAFASQMSLQLLQHR
jgi:hypothetical protein